MSRTRPFGDHSSEGADAAWPSSVVYPSPPKARKADTMSPARTIQPALNSTVSSLDPKSYGAAIASMNNTSLGYKGGEATSQHMFRPLQPFMRSVSQHSSGARSQSKQKGQSRTRSKRSVVSSLRKALVEASTIQSNESITDAEVAEGTYAGANSAHRNLHSTNSVGQQEEKQQSVPQRDLWNTVSSELPPAQITNTFHTFYTVHQFMMCRLLQKRAAERTSTREAEGDSGDDALVLPSPSHAYWELSDLPEYEHDLLSSIRYAVASLSCFESMLPRDSLSHSSDADSDDPVLQGWSRLLVEGRQVIDRVEQELLVVENKKSFYPDSAEESYLGTNGSGVEYLVAACVQQRHRFQLSPTITTTPTAGLSVPHTASVVGGFSASGANSPIPTSYLLQQAVDDGSILAQCELGLYLIARTQYLRWRLAIPPPPPSASAPPNPMDAHPEDSVEEGVMRTPPPDPPERVEQDAICPFALRLLDRAAIDIKYPGAMLQISLLISSGGVEPYMRGTVVPAAQQEGADAASSDSEGEHQDGEEEEEELSWKWWLDEACALDFAPAFVVACHQRLYPGCFCGLPIAFPSITTGLRAKEPWRASALVKALQSAKSAAELGDASAQFLVGKLLLAVAASGRIVVATSTGVSGPDNVPDLSEASNLFFDVLALSPIPVGGRSGQLTQQQWGLVSRATLPEFNATRLRGLYWLREAASQQEFGGSASELLRTLS